MRGREAHDLLTPLEISVMRFIDRNLGASAKDAAEASMLTSSNFSRALRSLEAKEFVRREIDAADRRSVRLFPTVRAEQNLGALTARWSALLEGALPDAEARTLAALLRQLESALAAAQR